MSTFKILSPADCAKLIKKIGQDGLRLSSMIHSAAVSTLVQIRDTGDWTQGARLLGVLPSGVRVKALAHWYGHYSNGAVSFNYNKGEGVWVGKLAKGRTAEQFDIEGAIKTPYGDLTTEKGYETQTVEGLVAMLKRKATSTKLVHEDGVTPIMTDEARQLWTKLYNVSVEVRDHAAVEAQKAASKLNADERKRSKAAAKALAKAQAASRADTDAALAKSEADERAFADKLAKLVERFGADSSEVEQAKALRASVLAAA